MRYLIEIALFIGLGFYVAMWGNPIHHISRIWANLWKSKKSAKTIYVKNDKELQKVVKDWEDGKIEIMYFSHNLINGAYEVMVKPISKN